MVATRSDELPLTGIVAAMGEELAPLRARLSDGRAVVVPGARVTVGRLGDTPVALAGTGVGARNARAGLTALLAAVRVRRLNTIGVAGGLSADLEMGALVVGALVVDELDGSVHAADAALTALVVKSGAARRGVAVTARRIAETVDEKRRLLALATDAAGAAELAAVVDLESAAFAAAAARAGVPWTVLRAVSDRADESVPALLNRSRDDGGAVRRGRVAWGLLADPRALPRLLVLGRRVRDCAEALADAVGRTLGADRTLSAAPRVATDSESKLAREEV